VRREGVRTSGANRRGEKQGSNRVNRGGSWNNNARNCRAANRNRNDPGNRNNNVGLRPVSSRARPKGGVHGLRLCARRATILPKPASPLGGRREKPVPRLVGLELSVERRGIGVFGERGSRSAAGVMGVWESE